MSSHAGSKSPASLLVDQGVKPTSGGHSRAAAPAPMLSEGMTPTVRASLRVTITKQNPRIRPTTTARTVTTSCKGEGVTQLQRPIGSCPGKPQPSLETIPQVGVAKRFAKPCCRPPQTVGAVVYTHPEGERMYRRWLRTLTFSMALPSAVLMPVERHVEGLRASISLSVGVISSDRVDPSVPMVSARP